MRIDCLRTSSRAGRWILGTTVACGMMAAAFLILWMVPRDKAGRDPTHCCPENETETPVEVSLETTAEKAAESIAYRPDDKTDSEPKEFGLGTLVAPPTTQFLGEAEAETDAFHEIESVEPEPNGIEVESCQIIDGAGENESLEQPLEAVSTPVESDQSLDRLPDEPGAVQPSVAEAAPTEPATAELETPEPAVAELTAPEPAVAELETREPAVAEPTAPESATAELEVPEPTVTELTALDSPSTLPAEPKPVPANPRAKEAFLKLWHRTPEFDNQLVALFANWQSGPSPYERRRGVERLRADEKAICVSSEKRWETVIKNLSVGGAELLHPEPVPRNTRLALVPPSYDQTVTGRVSWVRENGSGFRLGFNFDQDPQTLSESWVAETLLGLGSEFLLKRAPRRYVRVSTEVHSRLVTEDGRNIEVVLCDVSLGGCLLQSEEPFQVEELTLRLGSVDCLGKVVNNRQRADEGWSHHVTFAPMSPLETLRLLRTISSLLKKR